MLLFWVKNIRARFFKREAALVAAVLVSAAFSGAQTLQVMARAYHENATPARREALERYASVHPKDEDGALSLFALGVADQSQRRSEDAIRNLRASAPRLRSISDYVAYYTAAAELDAKNYAAVNEELSPLWNKKPISPLLPDAAMLAAHAYQDRGEPAEAVRVLRDHYAELPQPAGDVLLASNYAAAGDAASAAVYYQHVYFYYPATSEAESAAAALAALKTTLGPGFPPPTAEAMFQRAERWMKSGDAARAQHEYEWIIANTAGADRDTARVRLGEVDYRRSENSEAFAYLKTLTVTAPEADAERLYYLVELARRLERDDEMAGAIHDLAANHPDSPWRMKALITAANRFLKENRSVEYEPLYQACFDVYKAERARQPMVSSAATEAAEPPDDALSSDELHADYCHWKIAWSAYVQRKPEAQKLLREQLESFPGSDRAAGALYYLGRLSESQNVYPDAKAYYAQIVERFPNHYYAGRARERLSSPALFGAISSPSVQEFLNRMVWPVHHYPETFAPTAATLARVERASLLLKAGLEDPAERELRFGARTDGQPHVLAIQIAQRITKYEAPHRALRLVKTLAPGYAEIPIESAPPAFWRLLYPMPYRASLERYAKLNGVDRFMVAGLIRQESEFNPDALSPAQAYGLTQIMPSTGRMLLKASRRRFRPAILLSPEVNLRLGTTYLKAMYDKNLGKWEMTLAAYNAGGGRVTTWLTWADYREPSEFVESIPFSETRNYVFAVLRNADMYRKLYGPDGNGPLAADGYKTIPAKITLTPRRTTTVKRRASVAHRKRKKPAPRPTPAN